MPLVLQPPALTLLMALSFCFMMWVCISFTSGRTTSFVGRSSLQLVREGPFRVSRNPMCMGVLVSLAGLALCIGAFPMYVTVPTTFAVFNFFHGGYEHDEHQEWVTLHGL